MEKKMLFRKGAIFTVLSVVMSSLILITFFSSTEMPVDSGVEQVKLRVYLTNHYVQQSDKYVQNALLSSSHAAFPALINHIINKGYLSDFDEDFESCLLIGSFTGGNCPEDANINSIIQGIEDFVKDNLDIDFSINIKDITLIQDERSGPWRVRVQANFNVSASDGYARWATERTVSRDFDFSGLPDPTHSRHGLPARNFSFNESLTVFIEQSSTLNYLALDKEYIRYRLAPGFLGRLRGNLTEQSNCCGITSILLPSDVGGYSELSHLDFIWAGGNNCYLEPYRRFDFSGLGNYRDYGIDLGEGIDGAVVPYRINPVLYSAEYYASVPHFTNMSDSNYLENVVCG